MKRLHYRLLEFIDDSDMRGGWVSLEALAREVDNRKELEALPDALNYLCKNNLIKENRHDIPRYRILPSGVEILSNKELRDSVETLDSSIAGLQEFQARSSAVETIFTLFLLFFAFLQYYQQAQGSTILAAILISIGLFWALMVGGSNLLEVTISRFKELPEARDLKFYLLISFIALLPFVVWL